nr:DNA-binding domain-containing protein [uncultured Undibacterium sp.]
MSTGIQTHQQDLIACITSGKQEAFTQAAQHLRPNAFLSATQALAIYRQGYLARLLECLRADFPLLVSHLGETLFNHFATEYIAAHPPTSYSLFDLGEQFPVYLQKSCPDLARLDRDQRAQCLLPIELAKLERLQLQVLRAQVDHDAIMDEPDYHSEQALLDCYVRVPTTCVLLQTEHHLPEYIQTLKRTDTNESLIQAQVATTYIVVSRPRYVVTTQALTDWQYLFLQTIQLLSTPHSAPSIATLLSHLEVREETGREFLIANLSLWLPMAVSKGYVSIENHRLDSALSKAKQFV